MKKINYLINAYGTCITLKNMPKTSKILPKFQEVLIAVYDNTTPIKVYCEENDYLEVIKEIRKKSNTQYNYDVVGIHLQDIKTKPVILIAPKRLLSNTK